MQKLHNLRRVDGVVFDNGHNLQLLGHAFCMIS